MTQNIQTHDISYTQNRSLSWLQFNERVLEEAQDESNPLYERLKFVSIFETNLDEFFMVRVGSLLDLSLMENQQIDNKSGLTPTEQLQRIFPAVSPLYRQKDIALTNIEQQLQQYHITRLQVRELYGQDQQFVRHYFEQVVLPELPKQMLDKELPFPHLSNNHLYIAIMFEQDEQSIIDFIPVPLQQPRIVYLPGNTIRYVLLEDIILTYAYLRFPTKKIVDQSIICVTRNADINPDDEDYHDDVDYRHVMKDLLQRRKGLAPVRLEVQTEIGPNLLYHLCQLLHLTFDQVYIIQSPLIMSYIFGLQEKLTNNTIQALSYPTFEPQPSPMMTEEESIIQQVCEKDIMLHYPYEEMEPFLQLLQEAAYDEQVVSIKITIYRLSSDSKIVQYLMEAAENKKEVTVLMELRARFDEQNNIDWAEKLEEAGCRVFYGLEHYKVHSKICLITRMENEQVRYITQIGTGNYSEKTATLYTDICLITSKKEIGYDAATFFKNMQLAKLDNQYFHLLVAPTSLKSNIIELIEREIAKAKMGQKGKIILKMNSLTDRTIITKLSEASCAGVKVYLIIRGICCIVPQIKGKTENIMVQSIVGRFLEHARIYSFGEEQDQKLFISSADLMTRNTEKRVEIACPIYDEAIKQRINQILAITLQDNIKARVLHPNKLYKKRKHDGLLKINSQEHFMNEATNQHNHQKSAIIPKLWSLFRKAQTTCLAPFKLELSLRDKGNTKNASDSMLTYRK